MTDHDDSKQQHDEQATPALPTQPTQGQRGQDMANVQRGEAIDYARLPFGPRTRGTGRLVLHSPETRTHPVYAALARRPEVLAMRRLAALIEDTVMLLPEDDRAARIAYCRRTNQHGVRVERVGDGFRLVWGGRPLATLDADLLTDPSLQVVTATYTDAAPDSPAGLGDL